MRQLILKIPQGHKEEVLNLVDEFEGKNTIHLPVENHDIFIIFLPNKKVNNFLKQIDEFEKPEVSLIPRGVITMYPPASESPKQVADVQPKSSLEIYLGGIQSVGSMFGLIGYSFVAGIIVWIGLFTTTSYLLVAAMLVAPFAGPAMNAALATAAGKADLLKSSLFRYAIAIVTYHKFPTTENTPSLFVAPLFFWLFICSLLVYFLPGAAYFIIPAYFALLQLFVMLRQEQPISLLMAFLGLPAIFILLPFISMFPVALGLNILYVSALLCVLLFMLLLPVFGYLRRKKALALLCFLVFNILFITAHFKSDFNEKRPKPNSLVYLFNGDENTAHFRSYDNLPDEWTQQIFGEEPVVIPSEEKTFGSKYGSEFTWRTEAPKITLEAPTIILDSLDSQNDITRFSLKIVPNRKVNRVDLYADRSLDFEFFEANNFKAESTSLGEQEFHIHTRRWQDRLLTWHVSARDTLHLEFSLQRDIKPEFTLYESSYDLLQNEELNIEPRTKVMIPRPFVLNDAVIFKKTIKME